MKTPLTLFRAPSLESTAQQLADHLPAGRAWNAKNAPGSNMRKLVRSCAVAFNMVQQQIEMLAREMNLNLTTDLLPEWEASVGIPDSCVSRVENLIARRQAAINRMRRLPIVDTSDFEALALDLTGLQVKVSAGRDVEQPFDMTFPITFGIGTCRFKMYVDFLGLPPGPGFPYNFDLPLASTARYDIVRCVFNRVAPANIIVVFR